MKKLISIILAAILAVCAAVPAFAATDNDELQQAADKLYEYTRELSVYYNTENMWGDYPILLFDLKMVENFAPYVHESWDLCTKYKADNSSVTLAEINAEYKKLKDYEDSILLNNQQLKFLIKLCTWESNDNNYYSKAEWDSFQQKLTQAKAVYNENVDYNMEMTLAFWNLYFEYNKLCAVNQTYGDVDFNGQFNISDVTFFQKTVVNKETLNSSQMMISVEYVPQYIVNTNPYNIECCTKMQKALAGQKTFVCEGLKELNKNIEHKGIAPKGNMVSVYNFDKVYMFYSGNE